MKLRNCLILLLVSTLCFTNCSSDDPTPGPEPVTVESISIGTESFELAIGKTRQLSFTVTPSNAVYEKVEWVSSDDTRATVSETGLVTAIAEGMANVTVTVSGKSSSCEIRVVESGTETEVESITLNKETLELLVGETDRLTATVFPKEADDSGLRWISSDDSVVSVDNDGTVTAISAGKGSVIAMIGDIKATCIVDVVSVPVESITLNLTNHTMNVGEVVTLNATILPANADIQTPAWTTSDESLAIVDGNGKVTAKNGGDVVITATAGTKTATCNINIVAAPLEVGYYFYSDGTYSSMLDAGKTPIGVVFWVGDPGKHDASLKKAYPGCINGLVVSLEGDRDVAWQLNSNEYDTTVGEWISNNVTDYVTVTSDSDGSAPDYLNKIMGYNNTKAMEAFNAAPANSAWPVDAVAKAVEYRSKVTAPDNTSDWYLPSAKELSLLCSGEYEGNIFDIREQAIVSNRNLINRKLQEIDGAELLDTFTVSYWSSTEHDPTYVFVAMFLGGYIPITGKNQVMSIFRTRYVLAF